MNTRILIVPKNLKEGDLGGWLFNRDKNMKIIKIKKTTMYEIRHAIMKLEDYPERWAFYQEAISRIFTMDSKGKPDFFISNGKMFLLAEFKSSGDSLSQDQIIWMEKNNDLPTAIILAYEFAIPLKDKQEALEPNIITEENMEDKF